MLNFLLNCRRFLPEAASNPLVLAPPTDALASSSADIPLQVQLSSQFANPLSRPVGCRDSLHPRTRAKGNFVSPYNFDTLDYMYGHVTDEPQSFSGEFTSDYTFSGAWSDILRDHGVEPPSQHGLSRGCVGAVNSSVAIRRLPQTFNPVPADLELAKKLLIQSLLPFSREPPTLLGDIEITPHGASGVGFECCSTKVKAALNHYFDIHDYCNRYRDYPAPLFRYNHKESEVLPVKKLRCDNLRAIVFPPTHFYMLQKVHTQKLDTYLKSGSHPWFAYGCSPIRGYMNKLATRFKDYSLVFKGDATKFDSSIRGPAFSLIRDIRIALSPTDSADALTYIYEVLSNKQVVLPSGEIVLDDCQPSGQACTTSDNSLYHALILYYAAVRRLRALGSRINQQTVDSLLTVSLYSDDHVGATNDAVFGSYEFRRMCYAEMGVTLKLDDDLTVPSGEIEKLTFLGGSFHPLGNPFPYVYAFADPDAIPCLHLTMHRSKPSEVLQTLCSYAELLAYSKKKYNIIRHVHESVSKILHGSFAQKLQPREYYLSQQLGLEYSLTCDTGDSVSPGLICWPDTLSSSVLKSPPSSRTEILQFAMDTQAVAPTAHRPVPRRLAKLVASAEERNLITHDAFQAYLNLCNPFPDDDVTAAGWPGLHPVKSIPNAITGYADLTAPAGTTSTWNFHAVMLPFTVASINKLGATYNTTTGAMTGGMVPPGNTVGMFLWWTWKDTDPVPNFNTTLPTGYYSPHDNLVQGCEYRLCAGGIEAINTSAVIDRSGFGYAYRLQNTSSNFTVSPVALSPTSFVTRNALLQSPPNTPNEIVNLATTYTGSAERGVVCVNLPSTLENHYTPSVPTTCALLDRVNNVMSTLTTSAWPVFNWSTAGVFVTGLKPNASFKLKLRCFLEAAPLTGNGFNQTIARCSTPYSPLMLELVSNTLASMPAGFDYSENPFGEWMSKVLDLASHAFPAIGKVIPLPYASHIGEALGAVAGVGSRALQPKKPQPAKPKKAIAMKPATAKKSSAKK